MFRQQQNVERMKVIMTSKFLSRNGETYRVLLENEDTCWVISYDEPTKHPFCIAASEMDSFQRIPAPQNFSLGKQELSPAAQQRLALIQPLLAQNAEAITNRKLRNSIAILGNSCQNHGTYSL